MEKIGIYKIQSNQTNRIYIGSTIDLVRRWREHKKLLKGNRHHSSFLQNHYNKYGVEDLKFSIVENCNKENLIQREQYYLDTLKCEFNILKTAYSLWGFKHTVKTKEKIKNSLLGRKHTKERSKNISKALKGRKVSVEVKKKLSIPVLQYDLEGNFIKEWFGANEAARHIDGNSGHIISVCKGQRKTHKKYKWKYKMELIRIYLFGEEYGLFTYEKTQEPTMLINKCREIAKRNYENDAEDVIELEQEFIEQLEESGIKRVFINHTIFI